MTKIDIISGFLGAGKTTFIKKLLDEAISGEKVVLIENEFGEIGIDGGFLKDSGIEIREMNSGCICCSLVGDFGRSLSEVLTKYNPDRVIIEPSGVGKLSDVMKAVCDVAGKIPVALNGSVTVVDAQKCKMYMKNFGEFFNNQIESAGTIVLSRTDVADAEKVSQCVALIREKNPKAAIVTTPCSQLSGAQLLEIIEKPADDMAAELLEEVKHGHSHSGDGEYGHGHHHGDGEESCGHGHHHGDEEESCGHSRHDEAGAGCCGHGHHHGDGGESCGHGRHDEAGAGCCGHGHHHGDEEESCGHSRHDEAGAGCCGHGHHHGDGEERGHGRHDEAGAGCCGHGHHHGDGEESCGHGRHDEAGAGCCGHGHHHGDGEERGHGHHHEDGCGHDHHHHHDHDADEVFTSWGLETSRKISRERLNEILTELAHSGKYGQVLRAKGMLPDENGNWHYFDLVPEETEIREGQPVYTGKVCVIGSNLNEEALKEAFDKN